MERRPYFVFGDLLSCTVTGAAVAMAVTSVVGPTWNPWLAMAAGIATLTALKQPGLWERLETATTTLAEAMGAAARAAGVPVQQTRVGTMFCTFFSDQPVYDWQTVAQSDTDRFARFFRALLEHGVYLPPSQYEACFLSAAHDAEALTRTIRAAEHAFEAV